MTKESVCRPRWTTLHVDPECAVMTPTHAVFGVVQDKCWFGCAREMSDGTVADHHIGESVPCVASWMKELFDDCVDK